MLTPAADALAALLGRVRATHATVGDRYPLYADPDTAAWTTTRRGSWTGGYWVGLLWLLAIVEGRVEDRAIAGEWTRRLLAHVETDTVTRGMTFWYGAAIGDLLVSDVGARDVAMLGARRLADAYDSELDLIATGTGLGAGAPAATIDGVVGLVALLGWAARRSRDPALRSIAQRHATSHLELCLRADGSIRAHADPGRHARRRDGPPAHWARGQAWGMLAFTQAAQWLSPSYLPAAVRAADWWLGQTDPSRPARWDLDDPAGPVDSSASALAAVALLRLDALTADSGGRYRAGASRTLATLTDAHLTPVRPGDRRPPGMLLDGCYDPPSATATAHELIWGSFFLAQALAITTGHLNPLAV